MLRCALWRGYYLSGHNTFLQAVIHLLPTLVNRRSVVVQWVSAYPLPQSLQWGTSSSPDGAAHTVKVDAKPAAAGDGAESLDDVAHFRYTASSTSVTYAATDMCGFPGE
jgi:hypothetical protein